MGNGNFRFKKFTVNHDKCAMKVGTDGVLLGAWCNVEGVRSVLDVGTGSGLIALMVAQRNSSCIIDAVEIDKESFVQASANAACCQWSDRINMVHSSFSEYYSGTKKKFDLIVSNPPWFINSLTNPDPGRSAARHTHSLSMEDLVKGTKKLLAPGGRFCMIMPVTEAEILIKYSKTENIFCRKITSVHPNPGKPPKRYLMEFCKTEGEIVQAELILELDKRHKYSNEFKKLTGDFYLYFRY